MNRNKKKVVENMLKTARMYGNTPTEIDIENLVMELARELELIDSEYNGTRSTPRECISDIWR